MVDGRSDRSRTRWTRVLAWIGAWALVVVGAEFLPLWGGIALAAAVFAAQLLLAPARASCHLPDGGRDRVTKDTARAR